MIVQSKTLAPFLPVNRAPRPDRGSAQSQEASNPGPDVIELSASKLEATEPSQQIPPQGMLAQGTASAVMAASSATPGPQSAVLKVLTLNTFFDSRAGVEPIADLIRKTEADLVGLQESNLNTKELAKATGMHFLQQDKRTALLSRFPIEKVTTKKYGVAVTLDNGAKVGFLNGHLTSFPNQPHQLLGLKGAGGPTIKTEEQAIWWADKTRGREFRAFVNESKELGLPAIVTGDFNEPSHLDWTPATAEMGRHPIKVDWPGSRTLEKAGFKDSYRVMFPNEITHPGNTWTPTKEPDDPSTHHDRIDFVMYRGPEIQVKNVQIVGEKEQFADIVVTPYPTDHRAVLATFEVTPPPGRAK